MGDGAVRQRVVVVGAVALAATMSVVAIPGLRFTYVSPTARVAMEAAQAVIAGVVAVLVHGRVRRWGSRSDQLLLVALGLAVSGNLLTVIVRATSEHRDALSPFAAWTSLLLTLLGAVAYSLAGLLPDRTIPLRMRTPAVVVGGVLAATIAAAAVVATLTEWLPQPVTGDFDAGSSVRPSLDAATSVLAGHGAIFLLLVTASAGFARRAERQDDPLLRAVAIGLVLGATARLNYLLYPSIHTTVVHTGDVARLLCYLVLLGGAIAEISAYWRDRAHLAVFEERGRMARELHDGLVQELTFIRAQVSSFERQEPAPATIRFVIDAADRALDESRRAVEALSDAGAGALDHRIRRTVGEVADRAGLGARFDLAPGIHLDAATTEEVARVVREATTNVVRHASASLVTVSLRRRGDEVRVAVTDDGRGIDADARGDGFGLRSMRERAASVGGRLAVEPAPGGGTRVVLIAPARPGGGGSGEVGDEEVDERDRIS